MITDISPYIKLGWHTVPLRGKLERSGEDGSKTLPEFPASWRVKYQEERNKHATSLGGTITGKVSNIVAVDCDNTATWELFRKLDPDCAMVFISKGKACEAGTLIYEYDEDLADNFSIADGDMALDFYSNKGFIYLATEANKTKVNMAEPLPVVTVMPLTIKLLLKQLSKKPNVARQKQTSCNVSCLAPIVEQFVGKKELIPGLFRIITPRDFRDTDEYIRQGWLHPDSVPQGRGSEYLSKISAILGADASISQELYANAMHLINSLFSRPMDLETLDKTILDPMLSGSSSVNGVVIWQYDTGWQAKRLIIPSKRSIPIELAFDDTRNEYYAVDVANSDVKVFSRDSEFISYLEAVSTASTKKLQLKQALPLISVTSVPNLPFGFTVSTDAEHTRKLNTFVQTQELLVFTEPELYMDKYTRPDTTLRYLESLVPEKEMLEYLLRFVKTKISTFSYSPVVLYFLGVHGSGKDLFVGILESIIGKVARPTTKEFLEKHNGWLLDTYLVQLDEYGNQLTSMREREEALGKLKAYTGKAHVQIRQMRSDGFQYYHNATFMMTANKNPLMIEDGDRRVAFFATPNVLADQEWVLKAGGVANVYEKIQSELLDFCYYLSTEVVMLTNTDYVKPPMSSNKQKLIADSMYAAQRITYCIKHSMVEYFVALAEEYGLKDLAVQINNGRMLLSSLDELYDEMTEGAGNVRNFHKALRNSMISTTRTTLNGVADYFVLFNTYNANPFTEEDEDE